MLTRIRQIMFLLLITDKSWKWLYIGYNLQDLGWASSIHIQSILYVHINAYINITSLLFIACYLFQVGPGLVFLQFNHSFLGRGVMMHCVTPVEPLLQCVTHTMFYQASIPPVVPNFILKVESIQVQYALTLTLQLSRISALIDLIYTTKKLQNHLNKTLCYSLCASSAAFGLVLPPHWHHK